MANHRVCLTSQFATTHQAAKVTCKGCGRIVIYPPMLFPAMFPALTLVEEAEKRLRCAQCGRKGAQVDGFGGRRGGDVMGE